MLGGTSGGLSIGTEIPQSLLSFYSQEGAIVGTIKITSSVGPLIDVFDVATMQPQFSVSI